MENTYLRTVFVQECENVETFANHFKFKCQLLEVYKDSRILLFSRNLVLRPRKCNI